MVNKTRDNREKSEEILSFVLSKGWTITDALMALVSAANWFGWYLRDRGDTLHSTKVEPFWVDGLFNDTDDK